MKNDIESNSKILIQNYETYVNTNDQYVQDYVDYVKRVNEDVQRSYEEYVTAYEKYQPKTHNQINEWQAIKQWKASLENPSTTGHNEPNSEVGVLTRCKVDVDKAQTILKRLTEQLTNVKQRIRECLWTLSKLEEAIQHGMDLMNNENARHEINKPIELHFPSINDKPVVIIYDIQPLPSLLGVGDNHTKDKDDLYVFEGQSKRVTPKKKTYKSRTSYLFQNLEDNTTLSEKEEVPIRATDVMNNI